MFHIPKAYSSTKIQWPSKQNGLQLECEREQEQTLFNDLWQDIAIKKGSYNDLPLIKRSCHQRRGSQPILK